MDKSGVDDLVLLLHALARDDLDELDDVRVRAVRAQQLALLFQPLVSVNL